MTDQPPTADAATLEEARTRAGALLADADPSTDLTAQPGTSAHGVLAALLYAAELTGGGVPEVLPWAGFGDLDTPARALAEHREREDARAAAAALIFTLYAEPGHYAGVMRLVRAALLHTIKGPTQ